MIIVPNGFAKIKICFDTVKLREGSMIIIFQSFSLPAMRTAFSRSTFLTVV